MATTLNDLGKTLLAQLYEIVTGGDEHVKASENKFFSWCMPGIPYEAEDFEFSAKGLGSGATGEENKQLIQKASDFARLVDFVPDPTGMYNNDRQQTVYRTSEARLSHMYGEILNAARVVAQELTDEEKAKIEKFRNLLRTTRKVNDIVTDEEKDVTEDGPILKAYNDKQAAYIEAALVYNNKRIAAQTAAGPEGRAAVADFANNAVLYRMKVKSAMDAWVSSGHRNEVDQMNAYIDQVNRRNMSLWKQRLLEMYADAVLTDLNNATFYYTTLIPGGFASSAGLTQFAMSNEHVKTRTRSESNAWSVGGGGGWGLFRFGARGGGESSKCSGESEVSKFKISFNIAQVVISRPWFYPEFFVNRGWMLRKGANWTYDDMPSDGGEPPKGNFIGYPTTALFAKDIVIESREFAEAYSEYQKEVGVGGSVGWGPFRLSGSYRHSESGRDYSSKADDRSIRVPGMQIVGFVNHLIGKAPNPLPELKESDFE